MNRATILVPYDFHALSKRALALAEELAGPLDADVVVLHVHHPPVFSVSDIQADIAARVYNESIAATKQAASDFTSTTDHPMLLREGDPAARILEVIEELQPTLVIMGTHGRRRLARFFLGSVAEHVVRSSPAPVITVRAPEDAPSAPS